ncbi:PaaI family thioesterase [Jeongeupia naejangsanensis]|uniref:PaaI family thioesterase n=1 Tax=Jeongeupia naejangsanensis TaxID=613195 RepID=A0ABS2BKT5_9NEIS|nr:PaaI family thioesterase [Jeongeupia naejangsanensis]MBM3115429.1 PaaI family thioesterase [Jeongeupia naejangsanensis]
MSHTDIRNVADLSGLLAKIPYAGLIGAEVRDDNGSPLFVLPFRESNIGNTLLPALHGGVIGGFLENAAVLHLMWAHEASVLPRVVDFSLDYLRAGRPQDLYARCEIVRQGRRVANVLMSAWQDDEARPIATARAHFLLA